MLPVKIKIISFGRRMKEYREITAFYEKRIKNLCRAEFLQENKILDDAIILDERGEEMTSDEFYNLILNFSKNGKEIIFIVGPPEGIRNVVKNKKISLSKLTIQHDLAYLIILEQIYRSLLRMKGTNYGK